jgi:hypothetical protein
MYCPTTSMTSGVPCPVGSVCPSVGLTAVSTCPAAYFCNSTGLSAGSGLCSAGYYCTGGAVDSLGAKSTAENALPSACATGTYCPTGTSSPSPCPSNFYCPTAASVVPCTSGTFCIAGLTAPTICPEVSIVLTSAAHQIVLRTASLQLSATSIFTISGNPCFDNGTQPSNVSFAWTQLTSLPANATFVSVGGVNVSSTSVASDQLSFSFSSLSTQLIPSYAMQVSRVYLFSLAMTVQIGNSSSFLTSSSYLAVSVVPSALVARIR